MMAAASPRFNPSDTPESTVSGPRGDGYCLVTLEISSMSDSLERFERAHGHVRSAVILANALGAPAAQFRGQLGVFTPVRTVGLSQVYDIDGVPFDLHLMMMHPDGQFENICSLQPQMVITHFEAPF